MIAVDVVLVGSRCIRKTTNTSFQEKGSNPESQSTTVREARSIVGIEQMSEAGQRTIQECGSRGGEG